METEPAADADSQKLKSCVMCGGDSEVDLANKVDSSPKRFHYNG